MSRERSEGINRENGRKWVARTICTRLNRQRCTRDPKMQQVQHPTFEERVVRTSGGLEQRAAEYRNRVRLRFQRFAEGREQVRLLFRIRGHAERGRECLQWVHRNAMCGGATWVVEKTDESEDDGRAALKDTGLICLLRVVGAVLKTED